MSSTCMTTMIRVIAFWMKLWKLIDLGPQLTPAPVLALSVGLNHTFLGAGLPWWLSGKESICLCRRHGFDPWSRKIPDAVEQLIL